MCRPPSERTCPPEARNLAFCPSICAATRHRIVLLVPGCRPRCRHHCRQLTDQACPILMIDRALAHLGVRAR
jgi:hypothetical protein